MSVGLSTDISIAVQLIIGLVTLRGVTLRDKVSSEDKILIDILQIETLVQFIELAFYIFLLRKLIGNYDTMATVRYFDWFISTPLMLFTIIVYFKYEETIEKQLSSFTLSEFIKENKNNITKIVFFNFMMLLVGYLGETNVLPEMPSFFLGFLFFALSFNIIYTKYAISSQIGSKIFVFISVIWSLYGFSYTLNGQEKNIAYNILDILAKNFFGLYLYYKVTQKVKMT
jgi:bacteriorhodopsin